MKAFVCVAVLTLALSQPCFAQGPRAQARQTSASALSAQEAADLAFMREEEKLARDLYVSLNDYWNRMVFANISASEETHFSTLGDALARYNLADPALSGAGMFSNGELQALYDALLNQGRGSLVAAFRTGALVEEVDIEDLDAALASTSHADLQTIYTRLQCGSGNHLRAFVRNLETAGVAYEAQVLPQERVDAILAAPMGRCGGM
ncbi:MAG: DUF2202 domain-containing protein [Gallionellaceae bacterium]|nr:DUF2202 domain-containing protein [Gallionellaceae bacterium]MDD5364020.1 DUF2202 domain-containing protein [Gallionellaceae bacterium]